jgi:acyl carrier protein
MGDLHRELKQMIIDTLELEDIEEGLGLDSIDALEIGLQLQVRYGINLKADSEETRQHFANVNTLVALVESHRTK